MAENQSEPDPMPEIARSQRKSILKLYKQFVKGSIPDPDRVKSVADAINQLAGGAPWVGVAIQAVTFLAKCVVQSVANKNGQEKLTQRAEFIKQKLEELQDRVQDVQSLDPMLQKSALTLLGASCVISDTASRKRCAALRACACAQSDAAKLQEVGTQLDRLLVYINLEIELQILNLTPQPSKTPPELPEEQSALNKRKQIVMTFLLKEHRTRVIGLFGPGGIGKTTLLNAVYAEVKEMKTHQMAFVEVGQSPAGRLHKLQESLVSQLMGGRRLEFINEAQGRTSLRECLGNLKTQGSRVCMLLDDVWNKGHLKEILPQNNLAAVLPPTSYFLISSRSRLVADELARICSSSEEDSSDFYLPYSPELLDTVEARNLFVERASKTGNKLLPRYEALVNSIVPLCGGLPLALTVYASYFSDPLRCTEEEWKKVAKRLREAHDLPSNSEESLFAKLEVSLLFQQEAVQDAFLDVALLYRGWQWNDVKEALDEGDYLDILMDQSLITSTSVMAGNHPKIVGVHDLFHALAREFAKKINRFYIRNVSEAEELLLRQKDLSKVRAFACEGGRCTPAEWVSLRRKAICKMPELRYLSLLIEDADESIPLEIAQLKKLRYLQLYGFHSLYLLRAQLSQLRYLELVLDRGAEEFPEWIGKSRKLRSLELRSVDIDGGLCEIGGCVGNLVELESLMLSGHGVMETLPREIVALVKLRILEVSNCFNFERLPEEVGALPKLEVLNLKENVNMEALPETMGKLSSLTELILDSCRSLTTLPDSISDLLCLKKLSLEGCEHLQTLPENLGRLTSLQDLIVAGCTGLTELPTTLGNLSRLLNLDLYGCELLIELPHAIGSITTLTNLDLGDCTSLTQLPSSIGNLISLQKLNLSCCTSLTTLPQTVGRLGSLQVLNLSGCSGLVEVPEEELQKLRKAGVQVKC